MEGYSNNPKHKTFKRYRMFTSGIWTEKTKIMNSIKPLKIDNTGSKFKYVNLKFHRRSLKNHFKRVKTEQDVYIRNAIYRKIKSASSKFYQHWKVKRLIPIVNSIFGIYSKAIQVFRIAKLKTLIMIRTGQVPKSKKVSSSQVIILLSSCHFARVVLS